MDLDLGALFSDGESKPAAWERQPGEPDGEWSLFSAYLQAPTNNVTAFSKGCANYAPSTIQAIAARNRWRARRAALDSAIQSETTEAALTEARRIGTEHAAILDQSRRWLAGEINRMASSGHRMRPQDVIALMKCQIELDRLLQGQATARIELPGLADMSLEDLDRLDQLHQKALAPKPAPPPLPVEPAPEEARDDEE